MAPSHVYWKNLFSLGSSHDVLHPEMNIFFMQKFETLVRGRVVMLFQVLLKSVTCKVGVVLHMQIFSHLFLCLMCCQNMGIVDLISSDKIACKILLLLVNRRKRKPSMVCMIVPWTLFSSNQLDF